MFAVPCLVLKKVCRKRVVFLNGATDFVILNGAAGGVKDLKYLLALYTGCRRRCMAHTYVPSAHARSFVPSFPAQPFPSSACPSCLDEWTTMVYPVLPAHISGDMHPDDASENVY